MADDEALSPSIRRDWGTGRFLPGTSGNPGGRPKDTRGAGELARSATGLAIFTLIRICSDFRAAPHIQMRAAEYLLRRGFGRAPQWPGGVGRWPRLRENVQFHLENFVRDEGTDAVGGATQAGDLQHDVRQHAAGAPIATGPATRLRRHRSWIVCIKVSGSGLPARRRSAARAARHLRPTAAG